MPSKSGLLTTVCYKFGDQPAVYALEGSIAITGALVQWLRDNLDFFDYAPHIEDYAKTRGRQRRHLLRPRFLRPVCPLLALRRPRRDCWSDPLRQEGHIARAALEATAYQTREVLDAMNKDSGVDLTALKVDGGMVYNDTLMQFQADVLGVPVIRPKVAETTALGAAYAAGLAVGFWANEDDIRNNWGMDKTWYPDPDSKASTDLYKQWKKAVTRTFDWVEQD